MPMIVRSLLFVLLAIVCTTPAWSNETSKASGGFGIGAFEARSLITAMGGRLGVESRPGQGTTFTITLPAPEPALEERRKRA